MDKIKSGLNVLMINTSIYEDSHREINYLHRDTVGFYGVDKFVGIIAFLMGLSYSWGKLNVNPNSGLGKIIMKVPLIVLLALVLAGGVVASGVAIYGLAFVRRKLNNIITAQRIEKNEENLRLLREKCKVSGGFIESSTVLPNEYKYYHAVSHIYSYLNNMRADTLKEAINLYEAELKGLRDSAQLEEIARLSQRAVDMAEHAANSAANAENYARQSRYY